MDYIKSQIDLLSDNDIAKIAKFIQTKRHKKIKSCKFVRYPESKKIKTQYTEIYKEYIINYCKKNDDEELLLISLNRKRNIVSIDAICSMGIDMDSFRITMHKIVRSIISNNSYNVILVHSYPRYKDYDIENDKEATKRIMRFLDDIKVNLIDYYVASGTEIFSMRARIEHEKQAQLRSKPRRNWFGTKDRKAAELSLDEHLKAILIEALSKLSDREKMLIVQYYYEHLLIKSTVAEANENSDSARAMIETLCFAEI